MNEKVKAKWVAALRSGEYKQGKGRLITPPNSEDDETRFCCLGVLCDLAVKERVIDPPVKTTSVFTSYHGETTYGRAQHFGDLPDEVVEWAGLKNNSPTVHYKHRGVTTLTLLNDDLAKSFTELADLIEELL